MPLYMLQQHAERIAGVPICQQTIWILGAQRHSLLLFPPPVWSRPVTTIRLTLC